jgi:SET domain-containing protein
MLDIVEYINNTVFCKLGASPIHNVGVFAIRDIPKGTALTDYYGGEFKSYSISEKEFESIRPEIIDLIKQQTIFEPNMYRFDSPNSHQILEVFMNHSSEPNSDGKTATRDIKAGEEVIKDYSVFADTHKYNKKI